jgi:predicted nucleic acid-binding protein
VVNASPLIFLANAGLLDFLRLAGDPVMVPLAVVREIQPGGLADAAYRALTQTNWLVTVDPGPVPPVIQSWSLGDGEASVLTWALTHPGTEALVDDLLARRCAASLGLAVRGTVGLVLTAKQRGIIAAARPVLEALRQSGMYLSDRVMNQALAVGGE